MNDLKEPTIEPRPGKDHEAYMERTRAFPKPITPSLLEETTEAVPDSTYTRLKRKIAELLKRRGLLEKAQLEADKLASGNRTARTLGINIGPDTTENDPFKGI